MLLTQEGMYIIDVIPLSMIPRNQAQILSYFYKEKLPCGSTVEVTIGKRKTKAIVIGSDLAKSRKMVFKKNVEFELKNINKVLVKEPIVTDIQLKIAAHISSHYYSPLGISIRTILPPFWGKRGYGTDHHAQPEANTQAKESNPELFFSEIQNQAEQYLKHIKKYINLGKQVFILVPENTSANYFIKVYKEFDPIFISSSLTNKDYFNAWRQIESGKSKLVIGTRVGLFLNFNNLGMIIVDDESNENYKSGMMPRYNAADVAKFIAKLNSAQILYGSTVPRLETWYLCKEPNKKTDDTRLGEILNMIREIKVGNYSIFSRELQDSLLQAVELKQNTIIYTPRRGYSTFVLCQKCSQLLKCPNCNSSLVLHKKIYEGGTQSATSPKPILICHHCKYTQKRPDLCPACGSYKLKDRGTGTERVEEELEKFKNKHEAKGLRIFRLDSDAAKNNEETEKQIIGAFLTSEPSILITTQVIFSYQYELPKIALSGIISADTLINIPDFRAEESLFRQIYTLGLMSDRLIIQTHSPENIAIKYAAEKNLNKFFTNELSNRRTFSYPPFSQLVKLTYRHFDQHKSRKEASILYDKLIIERGRIASNDIVILPPSEAFISREKSVYAWNIIIKIKKIDEKVLAQRNELLRLVSTGWTIDVDPRNII
ncbi:MAG TPA: primosomal protein N' [Candidatus Paceibacterota bacterium]